jgi:hypothetical protein
MHIHIRTKISTWWSSIETAAIQIGDDTLEVMGGDDGGRYWINGKAGKELKDGDYFYISGFSVHYREATSNEKKYRNELGTGDAVGLETYKDFVHIYNIN